MKLMQGNIYVFASVIKNQCSICKIHTTKFIKLLIVASKEKLSKKINYPQIKNRKEITTHMKPKTLEESV